MSDARADHDPCGTARPNARQRAAAWVTTLGLDPETVVDDSSLVVRGSVLHYREFTGNAADGQAITRRRTRQLTPSEIAAAPRLWL